MKAAFSLVQNGAVEIRGEGVVLRQWRMEDAPAVAAACQDPEIARWLSFVPEPYTEADARFYVRDCIEAGEDRTPFAITDAETGDVIGSIDMRINRMKTGHVGYWLAPEARGRGLTSVALLAPRFRLPRFVPYQTRVVLGTLVRQRTTVLLGVPNCR